MFGNITVGKRLIIGFGTGALTLFVIAFISYLSIQRSAESEAWVRHTYDVRAKIEQILIGLVDAETGMRGFVITGDEGYLEPYNTGLKTVPAAVDAVRKLTSDNPRQQARHQGEDPPPPSHGAAVTSPGAYRPTG